MAAVPIIDSLQVQAWRKQMIKEVIVNCLWYSLSNRVDVTSPVPNAGKEKVPDDVMHWVTDSFKKGIQKTTIPFLQKLQSMGPGGWQKAEGEEETPQMRYKTINYNLQRKPMALVDESVEGDLTEYYNIVSQKIPLLTDYFAELTDYNAQRAIFRGADEFLTLSKYWTGQTLTSAPVTESFHPNWIVNGDTSAVTWNAVDATYGASLQAAMDALVVTDVFSLPELDSMVYQADSANGFALQKLGWKSGPKAVNYVGMLTEAQSQYLTSQTGSGTWRELMSDAGARGVDNRAISGVLGIYKRTLWLTDSRAPTWSTTTATALGSRLEYFKITDGRTPVAKTTTGTGTAELAKMLGKGALGAASIKDIGFSNKSFDYDFSTGICGQRSEGCERMDLVNTAISTKPLNQSSFIYATATPSGAL